MKFLKMKKIKKCDLCGHEDFIYLFSNHDGMYNIAKKYSLYKCKNCGLIFLNPQPNKKELLKHYPSKKYYSLTKTSNLFNKIYKIYFGKKFLRFLLLPLSPFLRSLITIKGGNLLDVGCGKGDFLSIVKPLGMNCYGVEPNDFDKDFMKKNKLNIFQGNLNEANFLPNFFDVITMNHVFEHMHQPSKMLKELYRILVPGGTLILATPISNALLFKIFGKFWVQLDTPRHLFIYSVSNLKQYANKVGFEVINIRYNSKPFQFIGTIFYLLNKNKTNKKYLQESKLIKSKILFLLFLPFCYIFNLFKIGDQVEIILKKPFHEK